MPSTVEPPPPPLMVPPPGAVDVSPLDHSVAVVDCGCNAVPLCAAAAEMAPPASELPAPAAPAAAGCGETKWSPSASDLLPVCGSAATELAEEDASYDSW